MKIGSSSNKSITLSNNDRLSFLSNLATLFNAGIPILETIESMAEDTKGNNKKILDSIHSDLTQGQSIYSAFAKFPRVFSKVTVNVVRAAEEAGTLDVVLKDIKKQTQKDMEFSDSVKSALTYPIVIFLVFVGVMMVILIFVLPKVSTVFDQLRIELPLPTRILIFISNAMLNYTIPIVIITVLIIAGLVFFYKTKKNILLRIIFAFPVVSSLVKNIDIARFARSMYLLLTSGITITNALELTKDVVIRRDISNTINDAQETVLAGKKLSEAFKERKDLFPSLVIKIIEAGEKTGTLDKSMEEVSKHMDYQVASSLKKVTSLLEPIMLVLVGVLVGGMMFSIISPIYGLISQVGSVGP